jgi:hypothetical protein
MADLTHVQNAVYKPQGGNDLVAASGGTIKIESGGTLQLEAGAVFRNESTEAVTTTNVITAAESGTHFILNTATAFVSTLPAPAVGLEYWFHIGATAPTTSHTVVTNASANVIEGSICTPETPTTAVTVAAAADTITFVANKAVHGDHAHVWCDGTTWYLDGMCFVQDGMTTSQAS